MVCVYSYRLAWCFRFRFFGLGIRFFNKTVNTCSFLSSVKEFENMIKLAMLRMFLEGGTWLFYLNVLTVITVSSMMAKFQRSNVFV